MAPSRTRTQPVPSTSDNQSNGKSAQEDELCRTFEECLSNFRCSLLHDLRCEGLVFCQPSKDDDSLTPPPLQPLAIANTQFLQYQDDVINLYCEASTLDCGNFHRCSIIRRNLLTEIQNELSRLDSLKRHAWQMASKNGLIMPSGSQAETCPTELDSARLIDTGQCSSAST